MTEQMPHFRDGQWCLEQSGRGNTLVLNADHRQKSMREQMTHFGNGEWKEEADRRCSFRWRKLSGEHASRRTNACKTCFDDHDECDVSVPTLVATHFVILHAHF